MIASFNYLRSNIKKIKKINIVILVVIVWRSMLVLVKGSGCAWNWAVPDRCNAKEVLRII